MNLKAIIPQGQTEITVNGLHQWDYGRKIEIHSAGFPAVVEVHFACAGMKEAAVRVASVTNGVAVVSIPDPCLEQTSPIIAWVFEIKGSTGATTKTIILPIKARPRPQSGEEIPAEVTNKYIELLALVNSLEGRIEDAVDEAVENATAGNITIDKANTAGWATLAGVLEAFVQNAESDTSGRVDKGLCAGIYVVWDSDVSPRILCVKPDTRYGETDRTADMAGRMGDTYDYYYCSFDCVNGVLGKVVEYRLKGGFEIIQDYASTIDCHYVCLMQFIT